MCVEYSGRQRGRHLGAGLQDRPVGSVGKGDVDRHRGQGQPWCEQRDDGDDRGDDGEHAGERAVEEIDPHPGQAQA